MATPTKTPAIPESLVRRLYKVSRLQRQMEVLRASLRSEILKLAPGNLLRAQSTASSYGDVVLSFTKRLKTPVDWDLLLKLCAPGLVRKVEAARRAAQKRGARLPAWISRVPEIVVAAALEKKKEAVA